MAVRQYIGARYVPTYYQNSLDPTSSEWEANVNYDPLTIVTLPNMHSYQSKKFVPSTVGSPASNPEYWYDQGYANAYYQALQDQIDDMNDINKSGSLQNQIGDLSDLDTTDKNNLVAAINEINGKTLDRKFVLFGDSYGENYTSGGVDIVGWPDKLVSILGLTSSQYVKFAESGYGFLANSHDWLTPLSAMTADNDVTDVLFCGGHNDCSYVVDNVNLPTYITNTINTAKTKFPNAKIWVAYCNIETDYSEKIKKCGAIYAQYATKAGAVFIDDLMYCLYDTNVILNHAHPNNAGTQIMANALASALNGGSYYNGVTKTQLNLDLTDANVQATNAPDIYFTVENDHLHIEGVRTSGVCYFGFATGLDVVANGEGTAVLGKFNNLPLFPKADNITLGDCPVMTYWTGSPAKLFYCNARFYVQNNYLIVQLLGIDDSDSWINHGHTLRLSYIRSSALDFYVDLLR